MTKTESEWDLKSQKGTIWGLANDNKTNFIFKGKKMTSQDVGNFHFGVVALAAVGYILSEEAILSEAGKAQILDINSRPEWQQTKTIIITIPGGEFGPPIHIFREILLPPYGDDPIDQFG